MTRLADPNPNLPEEILYRFPQSHAAVELVPDHGGTFRVRLAWLRGKSSRVLFESTPLRAIAEVTLRGQTFPVYLNQHSRKRRERIVLAGRRKTAKTDRAALRFLVYIEGRGDRFTWTWRVGATAPALATIAADDTPDAVRLRLPFTPGKNQYFVLPLGEHQHALAIWNQEIVTTFICCSPEVCLLPTEGAVELALTPANLADSGATVQWETTLAPASTVVEVQEALSRHAALWADQQQVPFSWSEPFLWDLSTRAGRALIAENRLQKRGLDRLVYRAPLDGGAMAGENADTALAACALLARHYLTGDDALRRTARLLAHGVCDFQLKQEESPQWGAIWDKQLNATTFRDVHDQLTLSTTVAARTAKGLQILHAHFQNDLLARTANTAAQWLLLRMDRDGYLQGERFFESGGALKGASPWAVGEVLIPLVETFRVTGNETFLRAALRSVGALDEAIHNASLLPIQSSTEHLAAVIEGVLLTSREYESQRMIALAQRVGQMLHARRHADGSLGEPGKPARRLAATLAGTQAALALTRVDPDPQWLVMALRGLRAADRLVSPELQEVPPALLSGLSLLPLGFLLAVATRAKNCVANRELVSITRNWQTFAPEPAAWEYVEVTTEQEHPVDFLPLVCPVSLQVLLPVVAPPGTEWVRIVKNKRSPLVRNLLTGELDSRARMVPLDKGVEATIGVFLLDT